MPGTVLHNWNCIFGNRKYLFEKLTRALFDTSDQPLEKEKLQ